MFNTNPYYHVLQAKEAEIEADKFATEYWFEENPLVIEITVQFFRSPFTGNPGDVTHLPTPIRADLIEKRFQELNDDEDISTTYLAKLRIWPKNLAPASMDVEIDDEYISSISNLNQQQTIELGNLSPGWHTYNLTDITQYNFYNLATTPDGLSCSGRFKVSKDRTCKLRVQISGYGSTSCGFE